MNAQSPTAKWDLLARKNQADEEEQLLAEKTGGRMVQTTDADEVAKKVRPPRAASRRLSAVGPFPRMKAAVTLCLHILTWHAPLLLHGAPPPAR